MAQREDVTDGLCNPQIAITPGQLLGLVCRKGGAECPLIDAESAQEILARLAEDPTVTIQLVSHCDELRHYTQETDDQRRAESPQDVLDRKRDLDVLQRLGLCPGDTRRSRYIFELLFDRVETPHGICAHDTEGWEGCALATSGAFESVRSQGWDAVVYCRSDEEREEFRERNVREIMEGDRIYVRPHHLMCMSCWYAGGEASGLRPNDTLAEILQRMRQDPEVEIVLVEGPCSACDCCDGFHPDTGRCVHAGGLIRDYKKDLDCFQKLGMMPGDSLPAREMMELLFERIPSTREICAYGDGVVMSTEWRICGGPEGNAGYAKTVETGVFGEGYEP